MQQTVLSNHRDHALVIGASLGGLLAARVLAEQHLHVTILERDTLPKTAENRKGVPQGRHAHALLPRRIRNPLPWAQSRIGRPRRDLGR